MRYDMCDQVFTLMKPIRSLLSNQISWRIKTRNFRKSEFDIVVFWKQNDTGLYGRRSDMLVKYLANHSKVRRILVFDLPIKIEVLKIKRSGIGVNHDLDIYNETIIKSTGGRDYDNVSFHTFIYSSLKQNPEENFRSYPDRSEYFTFIENIFKKFKVNPEKAVFWVYPMNPDISELREHFNPALLVADVVDDHRTWPGLDKEKIEQLNTHYNDVLGQADLAIANCKTVQDAMSRFNSKIRLLPNACEVSPPEPDKNSIHFKRFKEMEGPKIGYVGNLEKKIDIDLIRFIAEKKQEWQIILIGSTHANPQVLELDVLPNIHFIGVVKYHKVKAWIKEFDVAIIPHLNTAQTQAMNPLKAYVYCSLGVPVVSTKIFNLGELENYIAVADTREEFLMEIENAIKTEPHLISPELKDYLDKNSWPNRVETIVRWLEQVGM